MQWEPSPVQEHQCKPDEKALRGQYQQYQGQPNSDLIGTKASTDGTKLNLIPIK